jgi:hypothetical protein
MNKTERDEKSKDKMKKGEEEKKRRSKWIIKI